MVVAFIVGLANNSKLPLIVMIMCGAFSHAQLTLQSMLIVATISTVAVVVLTVTYDC